MGSLPQSAVAPPQQSDLSLVGARLVELTYLAGFRIVTVVDPSCHSMAIGTRTRCSDPANSELCPVCQMSSGLQNAIILKVP